MEKKIATVKTKKILKKNTKWGQNFLVDGNLAEKIVEKFLPIHGPILEIGPGRGIITEKLLDRVSGHKVIAVELDPQLCEELAIKYENRIQLICGDILQIRLNRLYNREPVAIIGNLPYYLSKEIIDWIIDNKRWISQGVVMLQREFVDKLLPEKPNSRSTAQSIMFRHSFIAKRCFSLRPGSFHPRPRIFSTLISFQPRPHSVGLKKDYYPFLKICFSFRRKTLLNNLQRLFPAERILETLQNLKLNSSIRSEELPPHLFPEIFLMLNKFRVSGFSPAKPQNKEKPEKM